MKGLQRFLTISGPKCHLQKHPTHAPILNVPLNQSYSNTCQPKGAKRRGAAMCKHEENQSASVNMATQQ